MGNQRNSSMRLLLSKTCPARCTDMSQPLALSTDETEVIFNVVLAGNHDKIKQAPEKRSHKAFCSPNLEKDLPM